MSDATSGGSGSRVDDCGQDCGEALAQLEAYLDGELPEASLPTIREHLAACYPCADRADFEQQLRAIVRRDCAEKAPAELVDRIKVHLDDVG